MYIEYTAKLTSRSAPKQPPPQRSKWLFPAPDKWLARIPVGDKVMDCIGVCFVQFDAAGRIRRNEVYFDRTALVAEIHRLKKG